MPEATAWTLADGDVQVTPNGGSAMDAEVRGRHFIARNVPLDSKADNSMVVSMLRRSWVGEGADGQGNPKRVEGKYARKESNLQPTD